MLPTLLNTMLKRFYFGLAFLIIAFSPLRALSQQSAQQDYKFYYSLQLVTSGGDLPVDLLTKLEKHSWFKVEEACNPSCQLIISVPHTLAVRDHQIIEKLEQLIQESGLAAQSVKKMLISERHKFRCA